MPYGGSGNDYHMLAQSGCWVYAVWASSQTGNWEVYMNRIQVGVCAIADFDGNSDVNPLDVAAFSSALMASDPASNVNDDESIDTADAAHFFEAYSASGGGNP